MNEDIKRYSALFGLARKLESETKTKIDYNELRELGINQQGLTTKQCAETLETKLTNARARLGLEKLAMYVRCTAYLNDDKDCFVTALSERLYNIEKGITVEEPEQSLLSNIDKKSAIIGGVTGAAIMTVIGMFGNSNKK